MLCSPLHELSSSCTAVERDILASVLQLGAEVIDQAVRRITYDRSLESRHRHPTPTPTLTPPPTPTPRRTCTRTFATSTSQHSLPLSSVLARVSSLCVTSGASRSLRLVSPSRFIVSRKAVPSSADEHMRACRQKHGTRQDARRKTQDAHKTEQWGDHKPRERTSPSPSTEGAGGTVNRAMGDASLSTFISRWPLDTF